MSEIPSLVVGGGYAGLGAVIFYFGRLGLEWVKELRNGDVASKSSSVVDASTANAVVLNSLAALQRENGRLQDRIVELEDEDKAKSAIIRELQIEVDAVNKTLTKVQERLNALSNQPI